MVVLSSSRDANFNMRAAFLEVLNDALGSLGVIVAAIVIATTGFQRADTIAGLFIAALILPRAYRLLRETVRVLMEFTPKDVDLDAVRARILELDHVHEVHDLHASTIGTGLPSSPRARRHRRRLLRIRPRTADPRADPILPEGALPVSFEHATIQMETTAVRERTCTGVEHF